MDSKALIPPISPERRLALAYAPARARGVFLGFLALDTRLSMVVRSSREPMLAQLKLAWWREQLAKAPTQRALGEPVLAALSDWDDGGAALTALVDGWEHLIGGEQQGAAALAEFANARGRACAALAVQLGDQQGEGEASRAGYNWALVDLAGRLSSPHEESQLRELVAAADWSRPRLSREMRPLLVLHGLAARARNRGMNRAGFPALFAAIRLGLFGI